MGLENNFSNYLFGGIMFSSFAFAFFRGKDRNG